MKRRYPPGKRLMAGIIDTVGPLPWALVRPLMRRRTRADVRRILVVEIWKLGDVVLATPALRALRKLYPSARITLLAQPAAATLLAQGDLVDEFIQVTLPWTAESRKYDLRRYRFGELAELVKRLRTERFDIAVDARTDPRNFALLALSGAARSVGLDHGGGAFLLTDRVKADDSHRADDWMRLVRHLGYEGENPGPELSLSPDERARAADWLARHRVNDDALLVGIHPGASVPLKRWAREKFAAVARNSIARGAKVLVFEDSDETPTAGDWTGDLIRVRLPLREMLAVMARCSLVVCNDSGPMHMAGALGVPTVSVFTNQFPELYAPRGESHAVAMREGFPCRPCFERCVFSEAYCNTSVSVEDVWPLVERRLLLHSR